MMQQTQAAHVSWRKSSQQWARIFDISYLVPAYYIHLRWLWCLFIFCQFFYTFIFSLMLIFSILLYLIFSVGTLSTLRPRSEVSWSIISLRKNWMRKNILERMSSVKCKCNWELNEGASYFEQRQLNIKHSLPTCILSSPKMKF